MLKLGKGNLCVHRREGRKAKSSIMFPVQNSKNTFTAFLVMTSTIKLKLMQQSQFDTHVKTNCTTIHAMKISLHLGLELLQRCLL